MASLDHTVGRTVVLKSDGSVLAWGHNGNGELGNDTTISGYIPVQVSTLGGVTAIAAGGNHTVAMKSDGTVWAWGRNTYGQLGDNTLTERHTPVQVMGLNLAAPAGICDSGGIAVCNPGTGVCSLPPLPNGTECAPAACTGTVVNDAHTCDANGACQPGGTHDCAPFACDPTSGACLTGCTDATVDCAPGGECYDAVCTASGVCIFANKPDNVPCQDMMGNGVCIAGVCSHGGTSASSSGGTGGGAAGSGGSTAGSGGATTATGPGVGTGAGGSNGDQNPDSGGGCNCSVGRALAGRELWVVLGLLLALRRRAATKALISVHALRGFAPRFAPRRHGGHGGMRVARLNVNASP